MVTYLLIFAFVSWQIIRGIYLYLFFLFFFFKQKTAYEMRISDWSSDVCSSDLYDRYPVCDLCIRPDDLDHRHHSRIWTLPGCAVVRIDRHALLRRLWRQDRELDR